jgi:hypothetical protein
MQAVWERGAGHHVTNAALHGVAHRRFRRSSGSPQRRRPIDLHKRSARFGGCRRRRRPSCWVHDWGAAGGKRRSDDLRHERRRAVQPIDERNGATRAAAAADAFPMKTGK